MLFTDKIVTLRHWYIGTFILRQSFHYIHPIQTLRQLRL